MANDGIGPIGVNNVEPLLQYSMNHRVKTPPEHNDVTIPLPMTPSEFNDDLTHTSDGKTNSKTIVRQAVALLAVNLSLGALIYWLNRDDHYVVNKTHPVVDALYRSNSVATKLFTILFVLVGFGFMDILLSLMVLYVFGLLEKYIYKNMRIQSMDDLEKVRSKLKVASPLCVVVLCLGLGVLIMHFVERIGWLDSFYFSVISVTTVGYGDRDLKTMPGRLLAAVLLLVSTLAIARTILYLAEARVDKRNKEWEKRVLAQDMSISDFLAAGISGDGRVSKTEYVLYKLRQMNKVTSNDIIPIINQFDKLDPTYSGSITLSDPETRLTSTNNLRPSVSF